MIRKFTINRAKWCGNRLMDNDGNMDSMGHFLAACGVKEGVLKQWTIPAIAASKGGLRSHLPIFHSNIPVIDENPRMTPSRREYLIKGIFKRYGVTVHYAGEYAR